MFYDILKKECDKQGYKIIPLVVECGGNKSSPGNWRKGASPNSDIVLKLARRLGVSTDYLLGNEAGCSNNTVSDNSVAVIGKVGAPVTIKNGHERLLSAQEQDLLRIYNNSDGKTQMKIMQFIYDIEEEKI